MFNILILVASLQLPEGILNGFGSQLALVFTSGQQLSREHVRDGRAVMTFKGQTAMLPAVSITYNDCGGTDGHAETLTKSQAAIQKGLEYLKKTNPAWPTSLARVTRESQAAIQKGLEYLKKTNPAWPYQPGSNEMRE